MNKEKITQALGFKSEATENEIISAIHPLMIYLIRELDITSDLGLPMDARSSLILITLKNRLKYDAIPDQLLEKLLVARACKDKKISRFDQGVYLILAQKDFRSVSNIFEKSQNKQISDVQYKLEMKKNPKKEGWTWDDYHKKAPKELEDMRTKNFELYSQLFEAKFGKKPNINY